MVNLAHLNYSIPQSHALSELAHLNSQTLEGQLQSFLLAKKVDGLSPRSIVAYNEKVKRFVRFALAQGIANPGEVTATLIRLFLSDLQQTNSPVSIKGYFGHIKVFFNWLVAEGMISQSPMIQLHPPKVPYKIIVPFTEQNILDLLLLCGNDLRGVRNRAIILTFLDTGLRLSEMAGIQLEDVDLDHETIKVMGKGAKERVVRIGHAAQRAIYRYVRMRTDRLPCLWKDTTKESPMQPIAIQTMIIHLGQRAGLKNVRCSPHTFRHTFGTMALLNGAGEFSVQSLLGHSTLTMTRKYVSTINSNNAVMAHKKFSPADHLIK